MRKKKIEIKGPNLPLDPIVGETDPEFSEIKAAHDALLAEFKHLDEIRSSQVEGASWSLDEDKRIYSVEEYNKMLAAYKVARKAYVERYREKLETIDMVREKIRKIKEEEQKFDAENPETVCPEPDLPDFEEIPNESWEDCKKRMTEHWQKIQSSMENVSNAIATEAKRVSFLGRRLKEIGKFGELEYELAFRLRHTYINPKTDELEYRKTMTLARA